MHISISYQSGKPIYEQIKNQIRAQVLSGELKAGEMLPSIRTLAKELQVGIITAKRAYDDLCTEGFLYSAQGKGVFVAERPPEDLADYKLAKLKEKLKEAADFARENGVDAGRLKIILKEILGE